MESNECKKVEKKNMVKGVNKRMVKLKELDKVIIGSQIINQSTLEYDYKENSKKYRLIIADEKEEQCKDLKKIKEKLKNKIIPKKKEKFLEFWKMKKMYYGGKR